MGLVLNILLVIREMEITHPASQLCCQLVITGDDIAMPTIPWYCSAYNTVTEQIVTILLLLKKFGYFSEVSISKSQLNFVATVLT